MVGADDPYVATCTQFEQLLDFAGGDQAAGMTHAQLEDELRLRSRELMRQVFDDHLAQRALREQRTRVVAASGVERTWVDDDHERPLGTVFGMVTHRRKAYRRRDCVNLYPADAVLNLPAERYSHGVRKLSVQEACRGSFDDATRRIRERTGTSIGKRQVQQLVVSAAQDVRRYYAQLPRQPTGPEHALVLTVDGKGIVMRPEALREATARQCRSEKLKARLSKGEKRYRKRMAEVGCVYDAHPAPRTADDVMARGHQQTPGPKAINKWLTASVANEARDVIADVFAEADRRDPDRLRRWVALVDGNEHQIRCIQAHAAARKHDVTIVVDFIHVLEYLWDAAWCFHTEGDPQAEQWVLTHAQQVLNGHARRVVTTIRRTATRHKLTGSKRQRADRSAKYLTAKHPHLDYPTALTNGWPIATGVIEGACRHLVKDRMDITGARWGLDSAEAILTLRTVITNGDLPAYWAYHLAQEHHRTHRTHYHTQTA